MMLSILIPSYNHGHFIISTLDSHVEENNFEYEIIIIDDGSTDNSVEVINEWIARHPNVNISFKHRENRGVTATFNQLIDLAQGKYIRLFGSDDISYAGANNKLVQYLEMNNTDAVFGYCLVIDEAGKQVAENSISFLKQSNDDYRKNLAKSIITRWAIVGPSLVLKKSVFDKIGKFDEKSLIEDWYLYLHLVSQFKTSFLEIPVAHYRIHSGNTSRTKDKLKRIKNYESQIKSGEHCLSLFEGKNKKYLFEAVSLLQLKKNYVANKWSRFLITLLTYSLIKIRNIF